MAQIVNPLSDGAMLSSMFKDIIVKTDDEYVDVALYEGHNIAILQERYYAVNGYVRLHNFRAIMEQEMRTSDEPFEYFRLNVYKDDNQTNGDTVLYHVIYCDRMNICSDVEKYLEENFLTTLPIRRIPETDFAGLYYYIKKDESIESSVTINYRVKNMEEIQTATVVFDQGKTASHSEVIDWGIRLSDLVKHCSDAMGVAESDITIISFEAVAGMRSATFIIDRNLDKHNRFVFRNCFNVEEEMYYGKLTTTKTSVEHSTAVVNGVSQFYNQKTTKTYETETIKLTSDEAEWIDQFLSSYLVYRPIYNKETKSYNRLLALITASTCEIQDGDEKLNYVKFTWRFADNRPFMQLPHYPNIFSETYNNTFS